MTMVIDQTFTLVQTAGNQYSGSFEIDIGTNNFDYITVKVASGSDKLGIGVYRISTNEYWSLNTEWQMTTECIRLSLNTNTPITLRFGRSGNVITGTLTGSAYTGNWPASLSVSPLIIIS